ncbi:oligosaccharide flippase family protein [Vibrio alginolyticus]|uniref:oligosaccharide flippase family protein n=1 Tax=Vibrio alginolyticus TaxID=663 RepID=UPI003E0FADFE
MISINLKKIVKNIISIGSVDFINILIPFLTMPLITSEIGVDDYAIYLLYITLQSFLITFVDFGSNFHGTRRAALEEGHSNIYSTVQSSRIVIWGTISVLIPIVVYFLFPEDVWIEIYTGTIVFLIGHIFVGSWFQIGVGSSHILVLSSIVSKLPFLAYCLFFINESSSIVSLVYLTSFPMFISGFFVFLFNRKKHNAYVNDFKGSFRELYSGLPVFIGLMAPSLYNSLPIIILSKYSTSTSYVLFLASHRLCGLFPIILNVISKSLFPILSRNNIKDSGIVFKMIFFYTFICGCFYLFLLFFGESILEVLLQGGINTHSNYLYIIGASLFPMAISLSIGNGFLLSQGYNRLYMNATILASIISSIITMIMINTYGVYGACASIVVSRFILSTCLFFQAKSRWLNENCNN